jgi:CRISPR/Cas system CSM-associated protein Csm3 (group 7 of RAMP superfamily)
MRRSTNISDYAYVSLEKPKWEVVIGHDKPNPKCVTGVATFDMEVTSEYLFVGDGRQGFCDHFQEAYHKFFRSKGQLTVPGTTLKGAVRSVAEAISASCVSVRSRHDNRKLKGYPRCSIRKDKKKIEICPTCRIFGMTNYRGHISFSDALPKGDFEPKIIKVAELWGPKRIVPKRKFYKNGQYRELKSQSPEMNYRYIEAVPKNSIFTFDLFFENAAKSDLSLVFHSMGIGQDFKIKIGGAKPRCLGNVSFAARRIRISEQLISIKDEDPASFIDEMLKNKDLIRSERLEELTRSISSKAACTGGLNQWN